MRGILFIIGILLSADGLFCGWTGSMGTGEAIIVGVGVMFILLASIGEAFKKVGLLRFIRTVFIIFMVILTAYSAAVCIVGRQDNATGTEKYVIIPGAGLNGSEPSSMLKSRLDAALEYASFNPSVNIIVSGGQGDDETVTEALAMHNYLIENGIGTKRVLIEDQATSTYENFALTKDAVQDGSTVIITNDFHVLRCTLMAQLSGVDATHISAPTPLVQIPVACTRELLAQVAAVRYYIFR